MAFGVTLPMGVLLCMDYSILDMDKLDQTHPPVRGRSSSSNREGFSSHIELMLHLILVTQNGCQTN